MDTTKFKMVESLCNWFAQPIIIGANQSVHQVLDTLNDHPLAKDDLSQDYTMPKRRYFESPERFRIWGENQDNYYCFVNAKDANQVDPPVYFETCLNLVLDCGVDPTLVLGGNCTLVVEHFRSFLAFMLAHHICLRLEKSTHLASEVNGVFFSKFNGTYNELVNPLGKDFMGGYTAYVGNDVICMPEWGAAFRNHMAREKFIREKQPIIRQSWS